MNRRAFLKCAGAGILAAGLFGCGEQARREGPGRKGRPNFIVILTDDQGYGDLGVMGAKGYETPNLDRMAREGMLFRDFYAGASLCAPSRAALMTGCYPQRIGLNWNINVDMKIGLSPEEKTIAEVLRPQGYATACIGKWHLGHEPEFLPPSRGFDEYFGLPYSHDMRPESASIYTKWADIISTWPALRLMHNYDTVEVNPDPAKLTGLYTEKTLAFIEANRERPFFIYLAHSMPHVPLAASERFRGKSSRGLYGDVMMELDWSVGQVLGKLRELGLEKDTCVVFISDNGPWLIFGNHGGSAGELREGKITTFEGGQRVPCIMYWPGRIPAGTQSEEIATSMDLMPTFAVLAGAQLPDYTLDGRDIRGLMFGEPGARSPHEAVYFYRNRELQAVRSGRWKLHVAHDYLSVGEPGKDGAYGVDRKDHIELSLFNLKRDPGETKNVAENHPEVVERLMGYIEKMRHELGDTATGTVGTGIRQQQDVREH